MTDTIYASAMQLDTAAAEVLLLDPHSPCLPGARCKYCGQAGILGLIPHEPDCRVREAP